MRRFTDNIKKAVKGKDNEITMLAAALLAGGHVLIEDLPGTGKTVLAKAAARSLDADFKRVQFTPDLLPSDITGINFYNMKTGEFILRKGGVFTNILLADEINRATPRTQSALLECMEERQVTIDGETYALSEPFMVIATQNPIETSGGTYPLPEAQLDRFLIRLSLGYADREAELDIIGSSGSAKALDGLTPVITSDELAEMRQKCADVYVGGVTRGYIADIGAATRNNDRIRIGLSTRGLIALKKTAQALAFLNGKEFASPREVKQAAPYVIAHRIVARDYSKRDGSEIVGEILNSVPTPTESV